MNLQPKEEDDAESLLPMWDDKPKELKTLFPESSMTERAEIIKPEQGMVLYYFLLISQAENLDPKVIYSGMLMSIIYYICISITNYLLNNLFPGH